MEDILQELGVILEHAGHVCRQAGIVFANGWLTIGYFLGDNGALLASLLSLPAILWGENRAIERVLGRSLRDGSGTDPSTVLRTGPSINSGQAFFDMLKASSGPFRRFS